MEFGRSCGSKSDSGSRRTKYTLNLYAIQLRSQSLLSQNIATAARWRMTYYIYLLYIYYTFGLGPKDVTQDSNFTMSPATEDAAKLYCVLTIKYVLQKLGSCVCSGIKEASECKLFAGGEDEYICDHTIDSSVFIPVSLSKPHLTYLICEAYGYKNVSLWDLRQSSQMLDHSVAQYPPVLPEIQKLNN